MEETGSSQPAHNEEEARILPLVQIRPKVRVILMLFKSLSEQSHFLNSTVLQTGTMNTVFFQ